MDMRNWVIDIIVDIVLAAAATKTFQTNRRYCFSVKRWERVRSGHDPRAFSECEICRKVAKARHPPLKDILETLQTHRRTQT
jgi:hypothetical protein